MSDEIIFKLFFGIMFALFFTAIFGLISEIRNPSPTYSLSKSEWQCSKEEIRLQNYTILIGKIPTQQFNHVLTCVEYKRSN